jgi:hypothetical protein
MKNSGADAELFRTERSHSKIFKTGRARSGVFIFSFHTLKVKNDGRDLYDDGYCIFANKLLKFSFGIPDPILDQNQDPYFRRKNINLDNFMFQNG